MTMQEATYFLLNKLRSIYEAGEASNITDWVMEYLTGSKKAERMLYKHEAITNQEEIQLEEYAKKLLQHEPVQYVLNEAWFFGSKFYVDKNVLIPRPETEELVQWIIEDYKTITTSLKILDIGTGSGCIPISLKKKLPNAEIWSCDISTEALEVAKKNASTLGTEVNFIHLNFLDKEKWSPLPSFDIIVSNPPYVPEKDKEQMHANVLEFEPATALFVPDNDPLVFYNAIAEFSTTNLNKPGTVYCEIHEDLGEKTVSIFKQNGFTVELKKDMQQKDRMVKSGLV